jgi:hypothetical protein
VLCFISLRRQVDHAREMSSNDGVCEIMEPYEEDERVAGPEQQSNAAASDTADSNADVEEERSNIEETEARLRFLFGNEDEWGDDDDDDDHASENGEEGHAEGGDDDDDDGDDNDDDDHSDEHADDGDDSGDDVQVDSGVDARYLADFTASVNSRRTRPHP